MQEPISIQLEFTPNPNTLKFVISTNIVDNPPVNLKDSEEAAQRSPLGAKLFQIPGVNAVMFGANFVTLSKTDEGDWELVHEKASNLVESHLNEGLPVLSPYELDEQRRKSTLLGIGGGSDIEKRVNAFLDREIRASLAQDGGDIELAKVEDGIAYVYLQGSCNGCPSSAMTLKMGIEARLKLEVPEVQEVIAL